MIHHSTEKQQQQQKKKKKKKNKRFGVTCLYNVRPKFIDFFCET